MPIAVDASSPAGVDQADGTISALTTASFTPPANALLLVCWVGNSPATGAVTTPTTTNTASLASTLIQHRSLTDAAAEPGQCAMWWAAVGASPAAMTVTVNNLAASPDRQARLKVLVLTGVDTAAPVASSAEGSESTGGLDTAVYTSTVADSLGFGVASDWDTASTTFTAGASTTVVDSGTPGGSVNAAVLRQTTASGTSGVTVNLALTSPTSTTWNWVAAEIRASAVAATPNPARPLVHPSQAALRAAGW